MNTLTHRLLCASMMLAISACDGGGENTDMDAGTDAGPVGPGTACERYCDAVMGACTGENAQYRDRASCLSVCQTASWPVGSVGAQAGNTVECRIYHAGVAAMEDPNLHCPHAGPTGDAVCGTVDFRRDAPSAYTRVDRMGMPAVSTALIGADRKNDYNDADPSADVTLEFLPDLAGSLAFLHGALDGQLGARGLTPCSMTPPDDESLPECVTQEVAPGASVASLVVPDTLSVSPGSAAGFPNGRRLEDPVIDVTLAIILLRMGGTCGASPCSPTSLVGVLNPRRNDIGDGSFPTAFPYLHPPHAL